MSEIGVGFLVLLVGLATVGLLVFALADLLRRTNSEWEAADQNQLVWALVVIFVAVLGPILYLAIARPALNRAASFN